MLKGLFFSCNFNSKIHNIFWHTFTQSQKASNKTQYLDILSHNHKKQATKGFFFLFFFLLSFSRLQMLISLKAVRWQEAPHKVQTAYRRHSVQYRWVSPLLQDTDANRQHTVSNGLHYVLPPMANISHSSSEFILWFEEKMKYWKKITLSIVWVKNCEWLSVLNDKRNDTIRMGEVGWSHSAMFSSHVCNVLHCTWQHRLHQLILKLTVSTVTSQINSDL